MRSRPTLANHAERHPRQRRNAPISWGMITMASTACAPVFQPDISEQPGSAQPSLPAILKDRGTSRLEALVSGRIARAGSCLDLEHSPGQRALIL